LNIDPNHIAALDGKGAALDDLGNYTGAIEYFDRAFSIDPHDDIALNGKGVSWG
jgi:Flp pilus assembly protein TadD